MKKEYNANDLYVGKIMIVINDDFDLMVSTTELKYIFERVRSIINKGRELYEEIATGVKMETEAVQHKNGACAMTMNYPYIVELEPFINYFPYNRDQKVTGKSMLLRQNAINFDKELIKRAKKNNNTEYNEEPINKTKKM